MNDDTKPVKNGTFTTLDERVINMGGVNYYRACDAFVRNPPEGGATYCIRQMGHDDNNHIDFSGHSSKDDVQMTSAPTIEGGVAATDGFSQDALKEIERNGEVMLTLNVSCQTLDEVNNAMDILLRPMIDLAVQPGRYVALSLYDNRDTDPST